MLQLSVLCFHDQSQAASLLHGLSVPLARGSGPFLSHILPTPVFFHIPSPPWPWSHFLIFWIGGFDSQPTPGLLTAPGWWALPESWRCLYLIYKADASCFLTSPSGTLSPCEMALNPKHLHLRARKQLKVTRRKGLRVVVRAGRRLRMSIKCLPWNGQAWICFTRLNSFLYSLLLVTVSISVSQYLALPTWKSQHTRLPVLMISKTP